MHARYAAHARTFFLTDFVSIENKRSGSLDSQAGNTGSIPVARSTLFSAKTQVELREILEKPVCPTDVPQMVLILVA
jgi:hypothetical protein